MSQSMAVSTDVYSSFHFGMKKLYENLQFNPLVNGAIYYGGTALGIFAFAYWLPLGYPWMHQEYQRAVLAQQGINSKNGFYHIPYGAVTGFADRELEQFKAKSNADFVRAESAGIEGYFLFADAMTRKMFFYNVDDLSFFSALFSTYFGGFSGIIIPALYEKYLPGWLDFEKTIKRAYESDEGQETRNFTFYDSLGWVYDLFRPDEPFAARGSHPSGDGVGRYISYSQLSDGEKDYLEKQAWLSMLNLFSPLLYSIRTFPLGTGGLEGNFALRHYLTSFGTDTVVQVFLKKAPFNMAFALHNYANYGNYFPAIEAELVDYPLHIGKAGFLLSPRILIGMQPQNQIFKTASPEFLGLFGLRVDYMASEHFLPYIDFAIKTDGWVAGNEFLEQNASVRLGLSVRY